MSEPFLGKLRINRLRLGGGSFVPRLRFEKGKYCAAVVSVSWLTDTATGRSVCRIFSNHWACYWIKNWAISLIGAIVI